MASSRKTLFLDLLQLNALKFYGSNNTPMPSSTVLAAKGNGETYFTSISSLMCYTFQNIFVPGQQKLSTPVSATLTISPLSTELILSTNNVTTTLFIGIPSLPSTINSTIISVQTSTLNSVQASTMYNVLNYRNILSSITYNGNVGKMNVSTLATNNTLADSGNAQFSSLQYNLSSFASYINPNGSTKLFIDYYPNISFPPVMLPSSISSTTLFPEGNSSIVSLISLSSHCMYVGNNGSNIAVPKSGIQQYFPVTSCYPYSLSSLSTRITSNLYAQPFKIEFDTALINSNISVVHYLSSSVGSVRPMIGASGFDVFRSGLDSSNIVINKTVRDKTSVFVTITNN